MTQALVAQKAGMPQSVIARIESGNHSMSFDTLVKVAHALGKKVKIV
jgi:transcriptional regulator with XRE-family HTH domain